MAEIHKYAMSNQPPDIPLILLEAQNRWLRPTEICQILSNYKKFSIAPEPPNRPQSGSLFLFDQKISRYFRKDGHNWRKKKDGKTVKEAHEKLKVGSVDVLHCYYAHGEENENFQRRTYWLLEKGFMNIVLVHYLEIKGGKQTFSRSKEAEENAGLSEGRLSPEKLGSKFGGYGSFLPTYQLFQDIPEVMSPELLRTITNNFSEEQKLGVGTFGTVYKGLHRGKEIAVKWLHLMSQRLDYEKEFKKEFNNLTRLKHPNIVQLLGYCYEIKRVCVEHEGRYVMADDIHRALCFEYMCKGSLQRHLDDEVHRLEWWACYKIIKGTCEGLKYLHESKMYHLDLKPGNILLDMNMVPKIADFGLSRLVRDNETHATSSLLGTNRYCPPEYIDHRYISNKFDIFSLGVLMIEIIAGCEGYCKAVEIPSQEFIDHVQEIWRKRLQATAGCISLIYECRQVKRCTEIALLCVSSDRKKRPSIGDITHWLEDIENNIE